MLRITVLVSASLSFWCIICPQVPPLVRRRPHCGTPDLATVHRFSSHVQLATAGFTTGRQPCLLTFTDEAEILCSSGGKKGRDLQHVGGRICSSLSTSHNNFQRLPYTGRGSFMAHTMLWTWGGYSGPDTFKMCLDMDSMPWCACSRRMMLQTMGQHQGQHRCDQSRATCALNYFHLLPIDLMLQVTGLLEPDDLMALALVDRCCFETIYSNPFLDRHCLATGHDYCKLCHHISPSQWHDRLHHRAHHNGLLTPYLLNKYGLELDAFIGTYNN